MPKKRHIDPVVAHERAKKAAEARTTLDYHVKRVLERAPELTTEQRGRISAILRGGQR